MSAKSIEFLFKNAIETNDEDLFVEAICQYINETRDNFSEEHFDIFHRVLSDKKSYELKGFTALLLEMGFQHDKLTPIQKDLTKNKILKYISTNHELEQLKVTVSILSDFYNGEKLLEVMKELLLVIPMKYEDPRKYIVDIIRRFQL